MINEAEGPKNEFEELKKMFARVVSPPAGQSAEGIKVDAISACTLAHAFFKNDKAIVIFKSDITYCAAVRFPGHCKNCRMKIQARQKAWQIVAEKGGGLLCKTCGDRAGGIRGFEIFQ